jgi:hypothetical protein
VTDAAAPSDVGLPGFQAGGVDTALHGHAGVAVRRGGLETGHGDDCNKNTAIAKFSGPSSALSRR